MSVELEKRTTVLEHKMDTTIEHLGILRHSNDADIREMRSEIRDLSVQLNGRIDELGRRIDGLNARVDGLGKDLTGRIDSLHRALVVQTRWLVTLVGFLAVVLPITFKLVDLWM